MQKQRTAFFSVSILALGLVGYALVPGAGDTVARSSGGSDLQQDSQEISDCGSPTIAGTQGCIRAEDSASVYGQLDNEDGSTTVWSLTFVEDGDTRIKRYRDLLLAVDGTLKYETVITVETGPDGKRELREVRNTAGEKVFHEIRRQQDATAQIAVEQTPIAGDAEEVIAVLQRATRTLQQAVALAPSV
ncbi:MAG: hypothetical protein WDZ84_15705 [Rhodovibrionaceae bacterium]